MFDAIKFNPVSVGNDIESSITVNESLFIHSVSPNPFNRKTKIVYQTYLETDVTISIFNSLGQKVIHLKSPKHPGGNHTFTWNGKNANGQEISSGVYFFSVASTSKRITKKLAYLK